MIFEITVTLLIRDCTWHLSDMARLRRFCLEVWLRTSGRLVGLMMVLFALVILPVGDADVVLGLLRPKCWALAHSVVLIGTGCCGTGQNDHLRMRLGALVTGLVAVGLCCCC